MDVTLCRLLSVCALLLASAPAGAESPEALARRHYARGAQLYQAGDYAAAMVEFERARAQAVLPAFTYNIGRCHERLGHTAAAVAEYERYLPTLTDAAEAQELRQRIESLRRQLPQTPPPEPPGTATVGSATVGTATVGSATATVGTATVPPGSAIAPPAAPRAPRIAAITLAIVAVSALAAGTGMYFSARNDYGELERVCSSRPCMSNDWADTSRRANAGYAMWTIGAAAAAVDVAMWILDARGRKGGTRRAWLAPTLGGAVAGASF